MLKAITIDFAAVTDVGRVRSENQDRWFADPELGLFMVADGLGGHAAGALAAQLVVDILPRLVRRTLLTMANAFPHTTGSSPSGSKGELCLAIAEQVKVLGDFVYKETRGQPGVNGTGTTLALALVDSAHATIIHAGDSRVYLLRQGQLHQVTQDHTLGQFLVRSHELSESAVAQHPAARRLTRYIGMPGNVLPDSQTVDFAASDLLLLCSDGLHGQIDDSEVSRILRSYKNIEEMGHELVAAANRAGGCDNVTVLLIKRME
ncbi:MAG: protein phosphatase 2C domain-containing protein [Planctomycetota bacterium]